jgi:transcriptional regulator with XRE-family HTH domain
MSKKAYLNLGDTDTKGPFLSKDAAKIEFARRLQNKMTERGLNQSELARRASGYIKDGKLGRDSISGYIAGKSLPGPVTLNAVCKVLGCEPEDILPARGIPSAADRMPPVDVRDLGDNSAWLRVNQTVPWTVAIQVLKLLKGEITAPTAEANDDVDRRIGASGRTVRQNPRKIHGRRDAHA